MDRTKQLVYTIGAIVEMLTVFRNELVNHGFTEQETTALCQEYLRCFVIKDYGRPHDAER